MQRDRQGGMVSYYGDTGPECCPRLYIWSQWLVTCGIFAFHFIELGMLFLAVLPLLFFGKWKLSFRLLCFLFIILTVSGVMVVYLGYDTAKTWQQITILTGFVSGYSIFFSCNRPYLDALFHKYLRVALIVALLGWLQFFIYVSCGIDIFRFLYRMGEEWDSMYQRGFLRISSVVGEPGYLAVLLIPAFVYYMYSNENCKGGFQKKCLLLATILFTVSSAAYGIVGIIFLHKFLFHVKSVRIKLLASGIGILLVFLSVNSYTEHHAVFSSEAATKFTESWKGLWEGDPYEYESLNLSSYALLTNIWVAGNAPSRFWGTGIGTHSQSYEMLYQSDFEKYGQNKHDAYSLLIRIYSEFGLLGIMVLGIFLFRNFNPGNTINLAAFFILIFYMLRGGNYFLYGTIYFFFFYYYSSRQFDSLYSKVETSHLSFP